MTAILFLNTERLNKQTYFLWKTDFITIKTVNTDDEMDAFLAALVFLQAEVGHSGCQLRHLTVQETRQS